MEVMCQLEVSLLLGYISHEQFDEKELAISEIAKMCGMTENNTSVVLHRTREKLKTFLRREGFSIE
jgi:DNA-directed RNA polymerase specialized sigma24 family protein